MRTQIALPEKFKLYIPDLDNHVVIENNAGGVVISATRDNLSGKRKAFFIRHLAAEGYIPDRYEWFAEPVEDWSFGVKWVVSPSPDETPGRLCFRKWLTRRNARYACLFAAWLLGFVWSVRHTSHGLGL